MATTGPAVEYDEQGKPITGGGGAAMEYDEQGKPLSAAASPVGGSLRPLTETEQMETTYPMGEKGESIGENVHNAARNAFTGAYGVLRHPVDTLTSLVSSLIPGTSTPNPIQATYEGLNTRPGETLSTMAGQAAVLDPAVKLAPRALAAAGEGAQRAGGFVADKTALGSNALDRRFGASPGRGISGNRIIGATKAGLKSKVDAAIPQIAQDRSAILDRSTAPPTNITPIIDQHFDAANPVMANPNVGVADPGDIAALTRARAAATFQQDPLTGRPFAAGPGEGPVPRDLSQMSPADIAEYNQGLRSMGNYKANADQPAAQTAIKGAGHDLRAKLAEVEPQAAPLTQQLYNTETASDVLQRQLPANEGGGMLTPSTTMAGMVKNAVSPLIRGAGTTAAAGLDVAGSGLKTLASKLQGGNPAGPPPAGATSMTVAPRPPAPANPPPTASSPAEMGSGNAAGGIPQTAGMTVDMPHPQAPPNVTLTEKLGLEHNPLDRAGTPPLGSNRGIVGPEGPSSFVVSPRRLEAPTPVQGAGSLLNQTDAYHGSKRGTVGKIDKEGLKPQTAKEEDTGTHWYDDPRLYFTTSKEDAAGHANFKGGALYKANFPAKTPVIFNDGGGSTAGSTEFYTQTAPDRSLVSKIGKKEAQDAVSKPSTGEVLPRQQGETGEAGGGRGGVGQGKQRGQTAGKGGSGQGPLASKVGTSKSEIGDTLYHYGKYTGGPFTERGVLYTTPSKEFAQSFSSGSNPANWERGGPEPGAKLNQFSHSLNKAASSEDVVRAVERLKLQDQTDWSSGGKYAPTPATAFSAGITGKENVTRIVNELTKQGFDHYVDKGANNSGTPEVIVFKPKSLSAKVSQNPADYPEVSAEGLGRADDEADQIKPDMGAYVRQSGLIDKVVRRADTDNLIYRSDNLSDLSQLGKGEHRVSALVSNDGKVSIGQDHFLLKGKGNRLGKGKGMDTNEILNNGGLRLKNLGGDLYIEFRNKEAADLAVRAIKSVGKVNSVILDTNIGGKPVYFDLPLNKAIDRIEKMKSGEPGPKMGSPSYWHKQGGTIQ